MILDWVPDCHHSVGHISQFESLKYRASLPAAFLFQIGPVVAYRTSLAPTIQTKVKARHCGNDLRPWNYIKLVWEQGFTCARMFMSAAPCKWHANLLPNFALTPNVMLVDRIPSKWRAISAAFWGWLANTKTHDELNLPENRWFSNILYILLAFILKNHLFAKTGGISTEFVFLEIIYLVEIFKILKYLKLIF